MKIKLSADSTCDLTPELREKLEVSIVPLTVTMGDAAYQDGVNISTGDIFTHVDQTGELPKSSAGNVDEYLSAFRPYVEKGYELIHVSLSSGISSAYRNACLAAEELGHVHVIDSRTLSGGQALLVYRCAELREQGLSAEEIVEDCLAYREKLDSSFVLDKLDYMYHGGRCTAVEALGANVLKLKPCIRVRDGSLSAAKKYRGSAERALSQYAEDCIRDTERLNCARIVIAQSGCSEKAVEAAKATLQRCCPELRELVVLPAGCTIATHCGPGALGIFLAKA